MVKDLASSIITFEYSCSKNNMFSIGKRERKQKEEAKSILKKHIKEKNIKYYTITFI